MGVFGAISSGVAVVLMTLGGVFVAGVSLKQGCIVTGFAFIGSVGFSLGKYLQQKPTPDPTLEIAAIESAKSVAQAEKAADAVQDAKDAVSRPQ
jgi:hypothetical protein